MRHKLAKELTKPINPSVIILLGIITFVWGLWLASPFWDVFSRADLYVVLEVVSDELAAGVSAMIVGALMIYGVIRRNYFSLMVGAQSGFCFWLLVSILYFLGDWRNTGGIVALGTALYCGFVAVNLRVNKGILTIR